MLYILVFLCTGIEAALLSEIDFIYDLPFIKLNIGTPGQKISMLLDTGSSRSVIPCEKFNNDKPFHIEKSTTISYTECANNISPQKCTDCSKDQKCMFNEQYGDGTSIRGYFFRDSVQFGQRLSATTALNIGCINKLIKNNQPNGFLGMLALMHLNQKYFPSIIDELTDKNNKSFAICFNKKDAYMSIGLSNATKSIPYSINFNQYYTIKVQDIQSEGFIFNSNSIKKIPIILDSGTNLIVFGDKQIFEKFSSHFNQYTNENLQVFTNPINQQCVHRNTKNDSFFDMFPTYRFQLENDVELSLLPQNYLRFENGVYCFQLQYIQGYPGIILGTPFMMGSELTFDQTNMQIHFTENCSYEQMKQTLLTAQNITKNQPHDIKSDAPKKIDQETQSSEYEDEGDYIMYLLIILVFLLFSIIISISYYLRRIKLIKNLQEQQTLRAEVRFQN